MVKPVLLRVEWVDCVLLRNEWGDSDDLVASKGPIVSVGFRVKSENGFLYLAASWQQNERHLPWAQTIAIPESAVLRKRRIG